jgi:hypothetical protein
MSVIDEEERMSKKKKLDNPTSQALRGLVKGGIKNMKTKWIMVGQSMFGVWRDKLYEYWGYEKFDHYTEKELGVRKAVAMKIVKAYLFLENYEPEALKPEFLLRETGMIPDLDAISVLRGARDRKELSREDYAHLRRLVFDKASAASVVRSALKNIIAEKSAGDEDDDKVERTSSAIRKFKSAVYAFKIEAQIAGVKPELIKKAEELFRELVNEL